MPCVNSTVVRPPAGRRSARRCARTQHQGIDALLDTMFGFLRRKTDFFTGAGSGGARDAVLRAYAKQAAIAAAAAKSAAAAQPAATRADAANSADAAASAKAETPDEALAREAAELAKRTAPREVEVRDGSDAESDDADADADTDDKASSANATESAGDGAQGDDKAKKKASEKGAEPNAGNGGLGPGYVWTQVLAEVEVRVPLEPGTRAKALDVVIGKNKLRVAYRARPDAPLLDGALTKEVRVDDSTWTIEDKKMLVLTLAKQNQMEWWEAVLDGHPRINTQKVQPENSKLSDLDDETRSTVEKMMFDQRAKELGQKTSDELQKEEMLKNFMAAHPEMDFSNAKSELVC